MDTLLLDAFTKLLATGCSTATVRAAETGTDCTELHRAIAEAGFLDALLPEDAGGGGLSLADVFPLVMACGEHLLPLPFAETLIARALVHAGGARLPDHARVVLAGAGPLLPQSGLASHALLDADGELQLLPLRDTVSLFRLPLRMPDSSAAPVMRVKGTGAELGLAAAAITAALMAGAMKRVLAMTLEHIGQREQFGRKIGQFQAVQQQAAVLGEEVLSVQVAARAGFVCDIAHALHGAIGATLEYDLQLFTRRIKHWQLAFGGESYWSRRLAAVYLDAPDRPVIDFIRHALGDTPEPSA
jgi:acyl-CoA dehydrogenase